MDVGDTSYTRLRKTAVNGGSTLDESTSTLCWGWEGEGGQKDHMLANRQSVPRLLIRTVARGFARIKSDNFAIRVQASPGCHSQYVPLMELTIRPEV